MVWSSVQENIEMVIGEEIATATGLTSEPLQFNEAYALTRVEQSPFHNLFCEELINGN